jgi:DNA repair protein RadA
MPRNRVVESIDDLPGVGEANLAKIRASRFNTLDAIATADPNVFAEETDIGEETTLKVIAAAKKATDRADFMSAKDLDDKRLNINHITTGSQSLDKMLGGGIETQAITEIWGRFSSGKSQLAFQLSVNVQKPIGQGGLGGKALFFDSENTFRPSRIRSMARAQGLNEEETLKNIIYSRIYNSTFQISSLEQAERLLKKENVKLIVVDSLLALFRSEYVGRETLAERQQKINVYMHNLQRISDAHDLAILVTNQVTSQPDAMYAHDPFAPVGGNVVAHNSTYRVGLRRGKGEIRIAKMIDSPEHPDQEAIFLCTEEGIKDVQNAQ